MKFKCNKNSILTEISITQEIISSRNALSILSNVLLEADNNLLTIKATDLKIGFETQIPVSVEESGIITVFCNTLLATLRTMPEGDISFSVEKQKLIITSEKNNIVSQLKTIDAEKFPSLKNVSDNNYFAVPQKDFIEMITQTSFAVSDDETRYFMNGVFFEKKENNFIMVATDGRRLSLIKKELDTIPENMEGSIIPVKILGLIKKLSSGEGEFLIAISEKTFFIKFDNNKIYSNLIEGQFPSYQKVIPEKQEQVAIISKEEFLSALKSVSVFVEEKSKRVLMKFYEGSVDIYTEETEKGDSKATLSCEYSGPEFKIVINCDYLQEPIKVMQEEDVSFKFTDPTKALTIASVPEHDYFHIVMPMQM
ncbi:MAG: DNA polymerase III subunit beta [Spirochaetaceae bacterium]|nr:DNA polymerase III subunit beta [Spirochaetaceae bacterium]